MKQLDGRAALITGAGQGLGAAIAEAFVAEGASVMLCARSAASLDGMLARLLPRLGPDQTVLTQVCDVGDTAQVDALVEAAIAALPRLDILVNNAGVYGPIGAIEEIDWEEWVAAITINLLGTVYPSRAILPHLRSLGGGKIINLSGGGATNPLPRVSAYAASKAAVVRFMETLAVELHGTGIDVNAIAPGALATRLTDQLLAAGPDRAGADLHARMSQVRDQGGTPLARGAALAVYLASAASNGLTGRLISAVWDPWPTLADHRADLQGSDIYTLRRIVPKDRGQDWGEV